MPIAGYSRSKKLPADGEPTLKELDRFREKFEEDANGCWIWKGSTDANGYPQFSYRNRTMGAKRFAVAVFKGLKLDKHTRQCGTKLCVHPGHPEE
jgi:hypothetical protein